MKVKSLPVGQLRSNCYLAWDPQSLEGIIIDPGDDGDYIIRQIQDEQIIPQLIIATHGHFDHVLAATELRLAFQIPFLIHEKDLFLLKRATRTANYFTPGEIDPVLPPDRLVKKRDKITFGKQVLEVMETPGHTPGSISLYTAKPKPILFCGDTLFAHGVGRTDFAYASTETLQKSIKKLLKLPSETIIYPGHGEETTIEEQRQFF